MKLVKFTKMFLKYIFVCILSERYIDLGAISPLVNAVLDLIKKAPLTQEQRSLL